jgi:hypothetical protein
MDPTPRNLTRACKKRLAVCEGPAQPLLPHAPGGSPRTGPVCTLPLLATAPVAGRCPRPPRRCRPWRPRTPGRRGGGGEGVGGGGAPGGSTGPEQAPCARQWFAPRSPGPPVRRATATTHLPSSVLPSRSMLACAGGKGGGGSVDMVAGSVDMVVWGESTSTTCPMRTEPRTGPASEDWGLRPRETSADLLRLQLRYIFTHFRGTDGRTM